MAVYFLMKYNGIGNDVETGIMKIDAMSVDSLRQEADKDIFDQVVKILNIQQQDKVGIFELLHETDEFSRVSVRTANPYKSKSSYMYKYLKLHFPRLSPHVKLVEDLDLEMFDKNGLFMNEVINKIVYDYKLVRFHEPADIYRFEVTHGLRKESKLHQLRMKLRRMKLFK